MPDPTARSLTVASEVDDLALVDLGTGWCGPCRVLAPWHEAVSGEHPRRAPVAEPARALASRRGGSTPTGRTMRWVRAGRGLLRRARVHAARRKGALRALRPLRPSLRPGLWVAAGPDAWHRAGARVPDNLRETQFARSSVRLDLRRAWRGEVPRRAATVLRALATVALPPWFAVVVPARRSAPDPGGGRYDVHLRVRAEVPGNALLFDTVGGRVRRTVVPPVPAAYYPLRDAIAAHVPTADLVERGSDGFVERLVEGRRFGVLGREERLDLVIGLVDRFTALTAHERSELPAPELAAVRRSVRDVRLPAPIERAMGSTTVRDVLERTPTVPTHGDVCGPNLLVTDRGLELIDLDPRLVRRDAFLFDVVHLIGKRHGSVASSLWRREELDLPLARLAAAAGWEPLAPDVLRARLAVAFAAIVLVGALTEERSGRASAPTADRLAADIAAFVMERRLLIEPPSASGVRRDA